MVIAQASDRVCCTCIDERAYYKSQARDKEEALQVEICCSSGVGVEKSKIFGTGK
jgi:hypothetical protein